MPTRALSLLERPHSWLPCFMLTAHPALATFAAFGAFPTPTALGALAVLMTLTVLVALTACPTFTTRPVQFSLPVLASGL